MRITLVVAGTIPSRGYGGTQRQVEWLAAELIRETALARRTMAAADRTRCPSHGPARCESDATSVPSPHEATRTACESGRSPVRVHLADLMYWVMATAIARRMPSA